MIAGSFSRFANRARSLGVVLLLPVAGACHPPRFPGPQIQDPPPGFTLKNDARQDEEVFPGRETLHHEGWIHTVNGFSGIYLTWYVGGATQQDVIEARQALMEADATGNIQFGRIELPMIDGRIAWGWMETTRSDQIGLEQMEYKLVVSYDTITYAIEFTSSEHLFKTNPDSIRNAVLSFAVGRTEWDLPTLTLGGLIMVVALALFWDRARRRPYEHLRDMTLIQIPVEDADGEQAEEPPLT